MHKCTYYELPSPNTVVTSFDGTAQNQLCECHAKVSTAMLCAGQRRSEPRPQGFVQEPRKRLHDARATVGEQMTRAAVRYAVFASVNITRWTEIQGPFRRPVSSISACFGRFRHEHAVGSCLVDDSVTTRACRHGCCGKSIKASCRRRHTHTRCAPANETLSMPCARSNAAPTRS
jgi:hypothetical protein